MNNKELKKFLSDSSWKFSKNEVESMLEKELEKEPENIDTEFVDICLDYLTEYDCKANQKVRKPNKKFKFTKLIAAVIIIVATVSISLTAYAKANNLRISDILVSWFSDYIVIDYNSKEDTTNTVSQTSRNSNDNSEWEKYLINSGFDNLHLPKSFYNQTFSTPQLYEDDGETVVDFSNKKYDIQIVKYNKKEDVMKREIAGEFQKSEKITVNGIDIYLFENTKNSNTITYVSYKAENTEYFIECKSNLKSAKEIFTETE